ncbi:hypothetical protein [Helicobacter kayseriensis]|uniref:F0F1 ATP synthase subunit B family protein n=1 Tax=Helicobacter kayseriensis TaxID=2905877 RepID=UPI001E2D6457|nr:hypothetical protein [Helicobacter kayseriensis]MCE3046893.1 hypothetical protein [Helicobacter kayseriensis]
MSLTLNPYLMLLVFIVFMALIICLNTLLYRPMLHFIQKRNQSLQGGLLGLDEDKRKVQDIQLEIQKLLNEAKQEAKEIRNTATKEAQKKYNESFERAKIELENRFEESRRVLISQHQATQSALQYEINAISDAIEDKISKMRSV